MVVGRDMDIKLLDDQELEPYVTKVESEEVQQPIINDNANVGGGGDGGNAPNGNVAEPMEVDS